ncbi:MAG: histone methyltransferase set2 [Chrysothrix sp. TS-e1954]|nr:MAG: histone methyltransferase set2 [Chrysothrix sp. TS-e1954]
MPVDDDDRRFRSIKKEEEETPRLSRGPSTPLASQNSLDPRLHGQRRPSSHAVSSTIKSARTSTMNSPVKAGTPVKPGTPIKAGTPQSPAIKSDDDVVGGEVTVKAEPGQPPKLSRATSQRIPARPARTYFDHVDKTEEACKVFTVIDRYPIEKKNHACGDNSDCINRATKLECLKDCNCGPNCQNRRFQKRQYANVTVFKTEKKGYGLRTDNALAPGDFIFEYIGEVIGEKAFHRRMAQYDQEGQKHFYFMSLNKGEFIDATKRGNLGRFCNHSCKPNCYVDKWVVGEKLRMGIFALRDLLAGEELVFNYNVDRYGANPQACFCGEPNCTGYIGGKNQTERATKLSALTIEALGIDDGDDWDTAVAKKPRKKKMGEDDEEYVDSVQPKTLDESVVTKVMATLMQTKEKWITVKLLERLQDSQDERVWNRVVRMHGYRILKAALNNFLEDVDVILQVLDVLHRLPRLTRNKIQDSKIEETVAPLQKHEEEEVQQQAESIMKLWAQLEVGYRIPRMKRDPNTVVVEHRRRSRSRSRSRERSLSPVAPRGPTKLPTGPRAALPQRPAGFGGPPRAKPFRPPPPRLAPLPQGWFEAKSGDKTYYYSADGQTTWQRPSMAVQAPPPPPKVNTQDNTLQNIINDIIAKGSAAKASKPSPAKEEASSYPSLQATSSDRKKDSRKDEPWRTWDETRTKKVYESTLSPIVVHCMKKYREKLPKDDLKKGAKECAKGIVAQDFRKGRIGNPTKITPDMEKKLKMHIYEYFDKAVRKRKERHQQAKDKEREREKRKAVDSKPNGVFPSPADKTLPSNAVSLPTPTPALELPVNDDADLDGEAMDLSDNDDDEDEKHSSADISPDTPYDLKRKREVDGTPLTGISPGDDGDEGQTPLKMMRSQSPAPVPPPPPPPPADDSPMDVEMEIEDAMPSEELGRSFTPDESPDGVEGGMPAIREGVEAS